MSKASIRVVRDLAECEALWRRLTPDEVVTDLWEVREIFHRRFQRTLHFVVLERDGGVAGFLPLCRLPETGGFCIFPGETWHGKTWIEQNRLIAQSAQDLALCARPRPARSTSATFCRSRAARKPPRCWTKSATFSIPQTTTTGSRPTGKPSRARPASAWAANSKPSKTRAWSISSTSRDAFERLVEMNLSRFGADSYFHDERFLGSFRDWVAFAPGQGLASNHHGLHRGRHGGHRRGLPLQGHVHDARGRHPRATFRGWRSSSTCTTCERACEERMREVDFLCGEFNWKDKFHLTPRPLYMFSGFHRTRIRFPWTQSASSLAWATPCDYIDLVRRRPPPTTSRSSALATPARAFFLTERGLRERAFEPAPPPDEEALCDLGDHAGARKTLKTALAAANIRPPASRATTASRFPWPGRGGRAFCSAVRPLGSGGGPRGTNGPPSACGTTPGSPCPDAGTASDAARPGRSPHPHRPAGRPETHDRGGERTGLQLRHASRGFDAFETIRRTLAERPGDRLYPESAGAQAPSPRRDVLCERYVEGPEFSCDFLLGTGKSESCAFATKLPAPEREPAPRRPIRSRPREMGLDLPAIPEILRAAARSLGFDRGPVHGRFHPGARRETLPVSK